MMKFMLITSVFMILLSGCAANKLDEPVFDSPKPRGICRHANHDIHQTKPIACKSYHSTYRNDSVSKKVFHHGFCSKNLKSTPILKDGFATVTYHFDQQPVIQTTPFQVTVIQLEPGEQFTNISSGDPSRWSYAVAVSGTGETAQQNILVKPSLPDISTNLVITTDKRLYNLRLTSMQTDKPTRNVNFWYPEESVNTKKDTASSSEEDPIEEEQDKIPIHPAVHCHYRITTGGFFSFFNRPPAWQPVRVFDDGIHTYIQFPECISQRDLPAFFVLNEGQKECVNYRFKAPYLIVDKIFEEAMLVSGVGRLQQMVILTNFYD